MCQISAENKPNGTDIGWSTVFNQIQRPNFRRRYAETTDRRSQWDNLPETSTPDIWRPPVGRNFYVESLFEVNNCQTSPSPRGEKEGKLTKERIFESDRRIARPGEIHEPGRLGATVLFQPPEKHCGCSRATQSGHWKATRQSFGNHFYTADTTRRMCSTGFDTC